MSIFLNFLTHVPIIISNFNTFEHKESYKKDFIAHFHEKLKHEKVKDFFFFFFSIRVKDKHGT